MANDLGSVEDARSLPFCVCRNVVECEVVNVRAGFALNSAEASDDDLPTGIGTSSAGPWP